MSCFQLQCWCQTDVKPLKYGVWSSVQKWKFATSVETFPDLILEMLYKAIKNKKVKVKSLDNAEKDETIQTSNMCNSKTIGSMILLQKF